MELFHSYSVAEGSSTINADTLTVHV